MVRVKSLTAAFLLVASLSAALAQVESIRAQDVPSRAQAINGQHSNGKAEPAITMPGPKVPQAVQQTVKADAPVELGKTQVYMFWATIKCRIRVSPDNDTIKIEPVSGPNFKIFAEFPDSAGEFDLRTRNEPFVWLVFAKKTGTVEILTEPDDPKDVDKFVRRTINAYVSPLPPQPPGPVPPGPQPPGPVPPGPAPSIFKDLRVLIIEESADRGKLPAKQREILFDAQVRKWLNDNCKVGPDGVTREWVIPDQDQDLSGYSKELDELRKRPRKSLPWIIIEGDGNVLYEDALPADVPSALTLLNKYKPTAR